MKKIVLVILAMSFLAFMACDTPALDYSGTWVGGLTDDGVLASQSAPVRGLAAGPTPIPFVITLIQNGKILSGSGSIDSGDELFTGTVISGSVTASEFSLELSIEYSGDGAGSLSVTGTFSSENSASGDYLASGDITGIIGISGTFTISKQ